MMLDIQHQMRTCTGFLEVCSIQMKQIYYPHIITNCRWMDTSAANMLLINSTDQQQQHNKSTNVTTITMPLNNESTLKLLQILTL